MLTQNMNGSSKLIATIILSTRVFKIRVTNFKVDKEKNIALYTFPFFFNDIVFLKNKKKYVHFILHRKHKNLKRNEMHSVRLRFHSNWKFEIRLQSDRTRRRRIRSLTNEMLEVDVF